MDPVTEMSELTMVCAFGNACIMVDRSFYSSKINGGFIACSLSKGTSVSTGIQFFMKI